MTEQDYGVEQPATSSSPQIPIDKIESLLKAKDDTSRFVGLALVKSVLENDEVTSNAEVLSSIWQSISSKFLDRLLRSQTSDRYGQDEAKDMVDLAVAVLHAFTTLLPDQVLRESRLTKRIVPLMNALSNRCVAVCPAGYEADFLQFTRNYSAHLRNSDHFSQSSRRSTRARQCRR